MNFHRFLRDWSLPIAMLAGVAMYMLYVNIPLFDSTHKVANEVVAFVQPMLIFLMLFITFCKIRLSELRLVKWHLWLVAFQLLWLAALSLAMAFCPSLPQEARVILESAMLCLICPTATAAAVITARLGGNAASLISYTMLINVSVAVVAPLFFTLAHPVDGVSFMASFARIISKVFPLLLCPLVAAEAVRRFLPSLHAFIVEKGRDWPFYLWLVALSLAIAITSRAIAHAAMPLFVMAGIALVSFVCCIMQFAVGRFVGARFGERITGGQALGQKNTVFAIWLAYTFLTPVTAIAGGFYSIWHNVVNTLQLYKHNHSKERKTY